MPRVAIALLIAITAISLALWTRSAGAALREEEIVFTSGESTLRGTMVLPAGDGPHPAVALVHGSGPGPREQLRREAEAFAQCGVATLIYDKRSEGYSASGTGERSYALLADDAVAAVEVLRAHPAVDANAVGLWGLSEGAWVVPLAANRSESVAFAILAGSSGVPPARQVGWSLENRLRHRGITGSMIESVAHTGIRVVAGSGGMAEGLHDPVPPLENLRQPVLAVWGEHDRVAPPAESAAITREALERGGNRAYTIRVFAGAQHGLEASADGFARSETLVAGYPEAVTTWIHRIARGERPGPHSDPLPVQERLSRPLTPLAWWESDTAQLAAVVLPLAAFATYPLSALAIVATRRLRGKPAAPSPVPARWARWLALIGPAAIVGFVAYLALVTISNGRTLGPVVAGRTLPWLALQFLAVATIGLTALVAAAWWRYRAGMPRLAHLRLGALLIGGLLFVPWALYWSLLRP